jgi:DNA polymerase-3 subunit delta
VTPEEYLKRLHKDGVPSISCFIGEEKFWFDECLQEISAQLFSSDEEDFGRTVRSVQGLSPEECLAEMATPPFFGSARLLVFLDLHKTSAPLEEAVLKGLERLAEGTYLVLYGQKIDKRRALGKTLSGKHAYVDCAVLKPYQAQEWVCQEARRQGVRLDQKMAHLLVERRGTAPGLLRGELIKASLFQGKEATITWNEWQDLIGSATETNIFGLLDGVAQGKTGQALSHLRQLVRMGEPEPLILFMLGKHIRQLVWAVIIREAGGNPGVLQKELGCHPYVAEKTWEQAKSFKLAWLTQAVERLLQAETRIKTGQGDVRWELEMAVVDLTA